MNDLVKKSFLYSAGVAVYIVLIANFMNYAESVFRGVNESIIAVVMLLMFAMSALIVGGLLVGKPIFLYIDGKKQDAVKMLVVNAAWLMIFFAIAVIILSIMK